MKIVRSQEFSYFALLLFAFGTLSVSKGDYRFQGKQQSTWTLPQVPKIGEK
jgi:hypothetical protein